ncbi:hypothetical protein [Planococcus halotolerans]|uniref:Uncharacterized protein n=1 Tax=Planococcus halotolerans TaxID=2233542 RepID=A0A365KLI5_9BACL|nr:hypothetical protein [Planococcus halotolerans]QHJ71770.1 hypothetical protein DNR44_014510 [Planococcus halotolerans]RAZ74015.1 hypothetical protein DP120_15635 [Planococcus halotolerans]
MKKLLAALTVAAVLTSLAVTPSMYVEQLEIPVIIIGTALLALMLKFPEDSKEKMLAHGMRIFAAFVIGWIFSTLDILLDHLFYYQPTGFEDGAYLALGFKYEEFADSFFLLAISCMAAAAVFILIQTLFKALKSPRNPVLK